MANVSDINKSRMHVPKLILTHHVHAQVHGDNPIGRFNTRVAVTITRTVGSMWCAYAFALLALISFPAAISSGQPIIIVGWVAQRSLVRGLSMGAIK